MSPFSRSLVSFSLLVGALSSTLSTDAATGPAPAAAVLESLVDYRLPLTMRGAYPVVEAWLSGVERPLHLVVDSAAGGGVIDRELALSAGMLKDDASSEVRVHGATGLAAAQPMAQVTGLRVGGMKLDGSFITTDSAFADAPDERVDGILGNNVTAMFDATFDVEQGELLLRADAVDKGQCYPNSYPERMDGLRRFPFIDVLLPGGVKARALIDTGAAQTVMNLAAVKAMGLHSDDERLQSSEGGLSGMGPGGVIESWIYDLPRLQIGEWTLGVTKVRVSQLPVFDVLSPDGRPTIILGIDVLRQRRVTITRDAAEFCLGDQ